MVLEGKHHRLGDGLDQVNALVRGNLRENFGSLRQKLQGEIRKMTAASVQNTRCKWVASFSERVLRQMWGKFFRWVEYAKPGLASK